jgi:hypothetical protein
MTKRIINFSGAIATMFLLIGLIWFANLTLPTQTNISPGQIKPGLSSPVVQPSSELTTDIPADFSWPILFESEYEGLSDIYLTTNGKDIVNLTKNPAKDTDSVWSPDGKWITFLSDRAKRLDGTTGKQELFVMDANGDHVTQLTDEPNLRWSGPLGWSSDGKWISAIGSPILGKMHLDLYVVGVDGSGAHLIGSPYGISIPSHPKWSPTEPVIAFSSVSGPGSQLYLYDTRTGKSQDALPEHAPRDPLTINVWRDNSFQWLEGGGLIYLLDGPYQSSKKNGVLFVEPTSSTQTVIKTSKDALKNNMNLSIPINEANTGWNISFSYDGQFFALLNGGDPGCPQIQILSTSDPHKPVLISDLCVGTTGGRGEPQWLPGNRWLVLPAWGGNKDKASAIYIIDAQASITSGQPKYYRLIDTTAWDRNPQPKPKAEYSMDLHINPHSVQPPVPAQTFEGDGICLNSSINNSGDSNQTFLWPTKDHQVVGENSLSSQAGIDLEGKVGDPVYASYSGIVVFAGYAGSDYGYTVILRHELEYQTLYANLQTLDVKCGENIKQGEMIGKIGQSGKFSTPVLYFEVQLMGYSLNPWAVLSTNIPGE